MTDEGSRSTPEVPKPSNALQLIADGDGLLLLGPASEIERFLVSQSLDRVPSKDLSTRLAPTLNGASGLLKLASEVTSHSGRWIQLTAESAEKVSKLGLMPTKTPGVSHAMLGEPGSIHSWLQIVTGPSAIVTNPTILAGAAGMMAQFAMQQMMEEITDYLAVIDEKVDDILRAQKDAVLADMIGVDLVIDEALTIRDQVGRVGEVTWSKVQGTALAIARTQAYALRQLDALAEKLDRKSEMGELASSAKDAETRVQEWLAVLAHCVRLQDGIAVLELDRVLDASPDQLDEHRIALRVARENRLQLITRSTIQLLDRMAAAAERANAGVLVHPIASPSVVRSNTIVTAGVVEFQARLGLAQDVEALEARRWTVAAADAWDTAKKVGADGMEVVGRVGTQAVHAFQAVDLDGDGIPDKPRALSVVADAGATVSDAASGAAKAAAAVATRAAGVVGSQLRRKTRSDGTPELPGPEVSPE